MKNIPEFSVSEITSLTKNILEENFERVRIRGEVSKIKENKGHLYFSLKDENFILNAICWSSAVPFLQVFPEEGMARRGRSALLVGCVPNGGGLNSSPWPSSLPLSASPTVTSATLSAPAPTA